MFLFVVIAFFFFFNDTATTEIYTLSLHDAPRSSRCRATADRGHAAGHGSPPAGLPVSSALPLSAGGLHSRLSLHANGGAGSRGGLPFRGDDLFTPEG